MQPQPTEGEDCARVPAASHWSRARQSVGIAIWSSFLAAAGTSVLCFAFVDPAAIGLLPETGTTLARMTGYAVGFFLFWIAAATASLLTLYLVRTAHESQPPAMRTWKRDRP